MKIGRLLKKIRKQNDLIMGDVITVPEYELSLSNWLEEEQKMLKGQRNYTNLCASLRLFKDEDGLLRLKGRFANSSLQYQQQHPIILHDKDRHFTQLLVKDAHETVMHHGIESTWHT